MPESSVMRALVVQQPGGPQAMRLQQLPAPQAGPNQVVVAVEAVGVNPVDAENRADPSWAGVRPPYVVGYEVAGRIQAVGDGAGWTRGDLVWGLLPVRGTRWGTYAELVALDAALVGPRPPSLSAVQAASLPLAGATAVQLLDRLDPKPGEWMLVHGAAGGVGSLLVQLARARGARVVASASAQRQTLLLHELGAEVFLDRHAGQVAQRARRAIGQELDLVADLVGYGTLAASLPVVREGGRAGSIVELAGDLEPAVDRNLTLHGVLLRPSREVLGVLAAAVADGVLRPVVDQVLDLVDAAVAHRRVESGRGQGKVVLRVAG